MASLVKNVLQNASTRILLILFAGILFLTLFLITLGYYNQVNILEEKELSKLESIAKTLALQIDGAEHDELFSTYSKNGIKTKEQDGRYFDIFSKLEKAKEANKIATTIYTLKFEEDLGKVCYGVVTSDPFFKHEYKQFPQILIDQYSEGAVIPQYETENGTWLSAFAPIKTSSGNAVGVVEIDEQFDEFIGYARIRSLKIVAISLLLLLIVGWILYRSIKRILIEEERLKHKLILQKQAIEEQNEEIVKSITYAKRIQDAILPTLEEIEAALPGTNIFYKPRDIVSGDFYWFAENNHCNFISAVDCTGHGVPGAFMSMIGHSILNDIVNLKNVIPPGEILERLDQRITLALKQSGPDGKTRDGMDMALCAVTKDRKTLYFAGAYRPLWLIRNQEVTEYKANRYAIGGGYNPKKEGFHTHTIEIQTGDQFYMFSDGYPDQFGGEKGKKFMNRRFKEILLDECQENPVHICDRLETRLQGWMQECEQVDDIVVIGLRF